MDSLPPYQPNPSPYIGDSSVPRLPDGDGDAMPTETLMEVLSESINVDPESGAIEGCDSHFTLTRAVLVRHGQEAVTDQVLDLLRAQGAHCDCEVLLNSRLDLVFLEDDLEDEEADDEADEEAVTD